MRNRVTNFLRWFALSAIVGTVVGAAIAFFLISLEYVTDVRMEQPWLLFLLPFAGALVSFLYSKYGGEAIKGNNLVISRLHASDGHVPFRMAPLVYFGTIMTHLFGGSAGREGTGVQMGASISYGIGKLFKLNGEDLKIILISGMSSGFGVVFGTPIAGTIFGLEAAATGLMYYEAMIPALLASFLGNGIANALGVHHSIYDMGPALGGTAEIFLKVILCAVLFGAVARIFAEMTHHFKIFFSKKFKNTSLKSFVGGLIIIGLTFLVGSRIYLGLSLDLLADSFTGNVPAPAFALKTLFTSLTLATGFQGGEVTPLFVIGASLGNFLSNLLSLPIPFLAGLGMIGVFCGATKTPVTSFVLGVELFGAANLPYLFLVCALSYYFSGSRGIYAAQVNQVKNRL